MLDVLGLSSAAVAKLADVAELNPRLKAKLSPDEAVSFVRMAALSSESASVVAEETRPYSAVAKGYTPFQDGDVLVAKITPCFENGKIGQANLSQPVGFGSTEFHVIRPYPDRADPRYLMHYLRQDHVLAEGERKMTGSAGQRRVPEHFIANLAIPSPDVTEQRRIAAILDQADMLRAKRRAALAQLDEMAQAIFVEMFGDSSTLFEHWKTITVGEALLLPLRNGVSPATDGKVVAEVLTLSAVTGNAFDAAAKKEGAFSTEVPFEKRVSAADLLICRGNGNASLVGRGFFPVSDMPNVIFPDTMIAARFDTSVFAPMFVQAVWNSDSVRKQIERHARTTNGTFKINQQAIESVRLILPPLSLQEQFAERMRLLQQIAFSSTQHSAKLDTLFASLQHRAFRGEL